MSLAPIIVSPSFSKNSLYVYFHAVMNDSCHKGNPAKAMHRDQSCNMIFCSNAYWQ